MDSENCPDVADLKVRKLLDQDKDKILLAKYEIANLKLLHLSLDQPSGKQLVEELINEKNKILKVDEERFIALQANKLFSDYLNEQTLNDKIKQLTNLNYNYYQTSKRLNNIELAQLLMLHLKPQEQTGAITELNTEDVAIIWTIGVVLEKRKLKKGQYDYNIVNSSNQVARYLEIVNDGGDIEFSKNKIISEIENAEVKLSQMIEDFNAKIIALGDNIPNWCKIILDEQSKEACTSYKSNIIDFSTESQHSPSIYSLVSAFNNEVYLNLFTESLIDNSSEDFVLHKKIIPKLKKSTSTATNNKNKQINSSAFKSEDQKVVQLNIDRIIGEEIKKACVVRYDGGLRNSTSIDLTSLRGFLDKVEQMNQLTKVLQYGVTPIQFSPIKASGSLIVGKGDIYKCCQNEKVLLDIYYGYGGVSIGGGARVYIGVAGLIEGFLGLSGGFGAHVGGVKLDKCDNKGSFGCISGILSPYIKAGGGITAGRGLGEVGVFAQVEGEGLLAFCPEPKVLNLRGVITNIVMTAEISVGWGFFNHNHKFCPWCPEYSCGKCDKNQALWEDKWVLENFY